MIIFITGFTASGKTTIGKELADILGIPFIDLDEHIETVINDTISNYFLRKGETSFRKLEKEELAKVIKNAAENCIISLGGGTMCSEQNSEIILSHGIALYLQRPLEYFLDNLDFLMAERPLFSGLNRKDARSKLINLFHHRSQFYARSQLKTLINTSFSAKKVANWLKLLTNRSQSL